jgi:hypothetical protein
MKRPPWNESLLQVAALPLADRVLLIEQYVLPAVICFAGAGAWGRARIARRELDDALLRGEGEGAVTVLPPGDNPWDYDWRALAGQVVSVYLCDNDRALATQLGEALLFAGAARVVIVDGRMERPRPIIAEIAPRRVAA